MSLDKFIDRAATLTGAFGNYRTSHERIDAETVALASCEMVNQEFQLFVRFVYRRAPNGRWLHINSSGQIPKGVWTPWGASGKSSLTRSERDIVRRYLFSLHTPKPPYPLFFYREKTRHWYVDTMRFDHLAEALTWQEKYKLTPAIWFEFAL